MLASPDKSNVFVVFKYELTQADSFAIVSKIYFVCKNHKTLCKKNCFCKNLKKYDCHLHISMSICKCIHPRVCIVNIYAIPMRVNILRRILVKIESLTHKITGEYIHFNL